MSRVYYSSADSRRIRNVIPDLVRSRGLLWDLVSKDLRARYRNAVMGFVWAVLQPLLLTTILYFVFTVVFPGGRVAGMGGDHPFAVYLLCGLVFWQFFASCLSRSTVSLLENHELVKKAAFPREVIPLASLGNCAVNCAIGFAVFVVVRFWLEGGFGWGLVWLPFILTIQCALIVGLSLLTSSLNVQYRDVGYIVEVALMFGFYATPIFYSFEKAQQMASHSTLFVLYMLNPMVGIITAYRQALLDNQTPSAVQIVYPLLFSVCALILGVVVFRRRAPLLADRL